MLEKLIREYYLKEKKIINLCSKLNYLDSKRYEENIFNYKLIKDCEREKRMVSNNIKFYYEEFLDFTKDLIKKLKSINPNFFNNSLIKDLYNKKEYKIIIEIYQIVEKCPELISNPRNMRLLIGYMKKGNTYYEESKIIKTYSKETLMSKDLDRYLDVLDIKSLSSFFRSNILEIDYLLKEEVFKLLDNLELNDIYHDENTIRDIEKILSLNPNFDRTLLLYSTNKEKMKEYLINNLSYDYIIRNFGSLHKYNFDMSSPYCLMRDILECINLVINDYSLSESIKKLFKNYK